MRIGCIGAGNMASAILRGLVAGGKDAGDLCVYDINPDKMRELSRDCGISLASSEEDAICGADVVILAVKPQVYGSLLPRIRDAIRRTRPLVISIAAGKSIAGILQVLGEDIHIVRVMPNINAKVGEAITAICASPLAGEADVAAARNIFNAIGETVLLDESKFSGYAALAGAAPAYTFLFIDALAEAGVRQGIPRDLSLRIARQTVLGSAVLLRETGAHPRLLLDEVCSPGGITVEGVLSLQRDGMEAAVVDAVQAACDRDARLMAGEKR
ncbi:MAG: pyrroline-5-carboxylate reductase [Clostridia bacterium]|nr:pyrroline-5-carboxylate reductase [Clostridia bacterium]MBR7092170.1 pyrroline-5-carboxylate reductase [Clostridia bacterium]